MSGVKQPDNYLYVVLSQKKKRNPSRLDKIHKTKSKHKRSCIKSVMKYENQDVQMLKRQNRILNEENKVFQQYFKVFQKKYEDKTQQNVKLKQQVEYFKKQLKQTNQKQQITTCYSQPKIKNNRMFTFHKNN